MQVKTTLLFPVLIGLWATPQLPAQDSSEGFVFTEAEVAAADENQRKIDALISDPHGYQAACREELRAIIHAFRTAFNAIVCKKDLTECVDHQDAHAIYKELESKLSGTYRYDITSGTFGEGALSRANLQKAKAGMTPAQYAYCDQHIKRAEWLMKWFYNRFSPACAVHHADFHKAVQQVARFRYMGTLSSEFRKIDKLYSDWLRMYNSDFAAKRKETVKNNYISARTGHSITFLRFIGDSLDTSEYTKWHKSFLLGSTQDFAICPPLGYGDQFAMEKYFSIYGASFVIYAPTAEGAALANYERYFEHWNKDSIEKMKTLGEEVGTKTIEVIQSHEYADLIDLVGTNETTFDGEIKSIMTTHLEAALKSMLDMEEMLTTLEDKLKETHYLKNLEAAGSSTLSERIQSMIPTSADTLRWLDDTTRKWLKKH